MQQPGDCGWQPLTVPVLGHNFESAAKRLLTEEDRRQLELLLVRNPDIERGEREPARVTRYTVDRLKLKVEPPPRYAAEQIKSIREQMSLSHPIFAAALYVSPETIRAWEQGKREPNGPTLRLLELAEQYPKVFLGLREGGTFLSRMEARDGSAGFDFEGTYTRIVPHETIEYRMSDGREVKVEFVERAGGVLVKETFDALTENSVELQRQGWQAILDNFGRHVEAKR